MPIQVRVPTGGGAHVRPRGGDVPEGLVGGRRRSQHQQGSRPWYWGSTTANFARSPATPSTTAPTRAPSLTTAGVVGSITPGTASRLRRCTFWCLTGERPSYRKASVTVPAGESAERTGGAVPARTPLTRVSRVPGTRAGPAPPA